MHAPAFPAIWPEASRAEVAQVQLATLRGRQRWRLSPRQTAERFAVEILGWAPGDVRSTVIPPKHAWWPTCTVEVWNVEGSDATPISLSMVAFGPWARWRSSAPGMAWSVERAGTEVIALDGGFNASSSALLRLAGDVQVTDPGSVETTIEVFDGPLGRSSIPFPGGVTSAADGRFRAQGEVVLPAGDGSATVVVRLTDPRSGMVLGLHAVPFRLPTVDEFERAGRRIWPVASSWYVTQEVADSSGFRSSRDSLTGAAERFTVEVLGWAPEDVGRLVLDRWFETVVAVWNERLTDAEGRPHLTLVTLERETVCLTGLPCHGFLPTRYWTVVSVDSPLVEPQEALTGVVEGSLRIGATFAGEATHGHLEFQLAEGAAGISQAPWVRLERSSLDSGLWVSVWGVDGAGWLTAVVAVVDDATGIRLAADAFPMWVPPSVGTA
jgi:hypothetical protein